MLCAIANADVTCFVSFLAFVSFALFLLQFSMALLELDGLEVDDDGMITNPNAMLLDLDKDGHSGHGQQGEAEEEEGARTSLVEFQADIRRTTLENFQAHFRQW